MLGTLRTRLWYSIFQQVRYSSCKQPTYDSNLCSKDSIAQNHKYNAHNYLSVPAVISRAQGVYLFDPEGKKYIDFLAGFGAVSLGHCNPKMVCALTEQAKCVHHVSRTVYISALGEFSQYITRMMGFDKVLPMNTGAEGLETAVKLCRKWGYFKKGIPRNQAKIIFAQNNFAGRTLTAVSASTDPTAYEGYGPYVPEFDWVPFSDIYALEEKLRNPYVCAYIVEPIQGEAGVIIPDDGYLTSVRKLCTKYNVLFVADEIQTGIGRTGKMLAVNHECVKPDVLILGKALSAGFYPVSCVLADDEVMLVIQPGTHGSTFGGNPLGCKLAMTALDIMFEEKVVENSHCMGELFRKQMCEAPKELVSGVRGRGLFNVITINKESGINAWDICLKLKENGLLTKNTQGNVIRVSPPLVISEKEMMEACCILLETFNSFMKK